MHIVFVLPGIDHIGGAERQVMLLAKHIVKRGHRAAVVVLSGNGGEQAMTLQAQGVAFLSLRMRKGLLDPRGWLRWLQFVRRERPDVVHSHLPHATWFTRWSRLRAPVPVQVDTIHTTAIGGIRTRLGYRWSNWLSDHTTAVSEDVAQSYGKGGLINLRCTSIIPNAIDLQSWSDRNHADSLAKVQPQSIFRWIGVGRLEAIKNYPVLLRAMTLLPDTVELVIAGSGSQYQSLRNLAQELGLRNRVSFLGFVQNLQSSLQASNAMVLASQWEGFPTVILEAGASGLPVVATDVPGTRCAVVDGVTGFLVCVNDPVALARTMKRLMDLSPAARCALGMNARSRIAAEFEIDYIADRWESLYHELMDCNPSPRRWAHSSAQATMKQDAHEA